MATRKGLSANKMAARILSREDNIYKRETVYRILNMYMDECRKALLRGERVQISKVGTIIPEVRTHTRKYYVHTCDGLEANSPYTRIRMSGNESLRLEMNKTLNRNIEKGVLGLEKLPFDIQQINILKDGGFIPVDREEEKEG